MDVLSQKLWGTAKAPDTFEQHRELVSSIGNAPRTNPLHKWKDSQPLTVKPSLPQKLDKPALGPNYRLTMELELTAAPEGKEQVLLAAPEGELLAVMKDGTVGFRRDDSSGILLRRQAARRQEGQGGNCGRTGENQPVA
ncbi:MAG: hypothetical protein ACLT38_04430 [Akkermansia sp.]